MEALGPTIVRLRTERVNPLGKLAKTSINVDISFEVLLVAYGASTAGICGLLSRYLRCQQATMFNAKMIHWN